MHKRLDIVDVEGSVKRTSRSSVHAGYGFIAFATHKRRDAELFC